LHDSVREDTRYSGGHTADEVENCVQLLQFKACVPAGKQVRTAGEESSFKNTEDDAESEHLVPFLDETKGLKHVRDGEQRRLNEETYDHASAP
jgi:hypothetical protein